MFQVGDSLEHYSLLCYYANYDHKMFHDKGFLLQSVVYLYKLFFGKYKYTLWKLANDNKFVQGSWWYSAFPFSECSLHNL